MQVCVNILLARHLSLLCKMPLINVEHVITASAHIDTFNCIPFKSTVLTSVMQLHHVFAANILSAR